MEEQTPASTPNPVQNPDPTTEKISKKGMRIFIGIQAFLLIAVAFAIIMNGEYGWTLFCIIPFSLGMTAGVYSRTYNSKRFLKGFALILVGITAFGILMIAVGVEGFICLLMAAGMIALPLLAGMTIGYLIRNAHKVYGLALIILLNSSAYVYDKNDSSEINSTTSESILINASREHVWSILTRPVNYSLHENFFFKAGISYPTTMQLEQRKDGNCFLACKLNNGIADLPVQKIDSLQRIRFGFPETVVHMKELSPYDSLDAEHLHGYFNPKYGEFRLSAVDKDHCLLMAETSYSYKITPAFYWQWWSDYLINAMHRHVLADLKTQSEASR